MDAPTEWTYGGQIDWSSADSLRLAPAGLVLQTIIEAVKERYAAITSMVPGVRLPMLLGGDMYGAAAGFDDATQTYVVNMNIGHGFTSEHSVTVTWEGGQRRWCVIPYYAANQWVALSGGVGDTLPTSGKVMLSVDFNPLRPVKEYTDAIQGAVDYLIRDGVFYGKNWFVKHIDHGGDWSGVGKDYVWPRWNEAGILASIGAEERLVSDVLSPLSAAWCFQQYQILNLLRWFSPYSPYLDVDVTRSKFGSGTVEGTTAEHWELEKLGEAYALAVEDWENAAEEEGGSDPNFFKSIISSRLSISGGSYGSPYSYNADVETHHFNAGWFFFHAGNLTYKSCLVDVYAYVAKYADQSGRRTYPPTGYNLEEYCKANSNSELDWKYAGNDTSSSTAPYDFIRTKPFYWGPPLPMPPYSDDIWEYYAVIGYYDYGSLETTERNPVVICKFDVPGGFKFVD